MSTQAPTDAIARYYDVNTRAFVRWGQGGPILHRAVWAPGVADRQAAFDWIHQRLVVELRAAVAATGASSPTVLDLGCGTGATLETLLACGAHRGVGITNSRVQSDEARRRLAAVHGARAQVLLGDFCQVRWDGRADLVAAVESFVHAGQPETFFSRAAGWLRPGGRLVVCDDFIGQQVGVPRGSDGDRWIEEVRRSWLMHSLLTPDQIHALARDQGLEPLGDQDLTSYLELDRWRDRVLAAVMRIMRMLGLAAVSSHPRWIAWRGGDALRRCLQQRILAYRLMVWRRP